MKMGIKTGSATILGPATQGNKKTSWQTEGKKIWNHGSLGMDSEYKIILEPIEHSCQRTWADPTVVMLPHTSESLLPSGTFLMNRGVEHGGCSHWSGKRGLMHTPQTDFLSSKQTRLQLDMNVPSVYLLDLLTSLVESQSVPCCLILNCSYQERELPSIFLLSPGYASARPANHRLSSEHFILHLIVSPKLAVKGVSWLKNEVDKLIQKQLIASSSLLIKVLALELGQMASDSRFWDLTGHLVPDNTASHRIPVRMWLWNQNKVLLPVARSQGVEGTMMWPMASFRHSLLISTQGRNAFFHHGISIILVNWMIKWVTWALWGWRKLTGNGILSYLWWLSLHNKRKFKWIWEKYDRE